MNNPFRLTRAADLNDDEISALWVDPQGTLATLLRPASALPTFIFGGRGSGKTHLMRYHSYAIQRKVHTPQGMMRLVTEAAYIGIHTRCRGLNASRFSAKRLGDAKSHDLFSYHLELWLGQLLFHTACEFFNDAGVTTEIDQGSLMQDLLDLFDIHPQLDALSLDNFSRGLRQLQRELDIAVNNASFRRAIDLKIPVTPGRLVFGIPQVLTKHVPVLEGVMFSLFVDEYEHLYEEQQKHFNTLIRERENPVTFKIGARLHGMRTPRTWGGDEELREGSDYEKLNLDEALRDNEETYADFASALCISRIRFENGNLPIGWTEGDSVRRFKQCFELAQPAEVKVAEKLALSDERPWLENLRTHLLANSRSVRPLGIDNPSGVDSLISLLSFPADALIEKTNTFLLYRAWSREKHLHEAGVEIAASAALYHSTGDKNTVHAKRLAHFREDLRSQMLMELNLHWADLLQGYTGLDAWIRMSDGIIRNLITTLKRVFDWAIFSSDDVYAPSGIRLASQTRGVKEASNWFIEDSKAVGEDHGMVETGLKRVARLLSALRFSEKLPECSLCTFSVELNALAELPRRILQTCEMWSLLIRTADRKERNTGSHVVKFRVNGLISPEFNLPFSSRGNIHLRTDEASVIFGTRSEDEFGRVLGMRLSRCVPPFGNVSQAPGSDREQDELNLF